MNKVYFYFYNLVICLALNFSFANAMDINKKIVFENDPTRAIYSCMIKLQESIINDFKTINDLYNIADENSGIIKKHSDLLWSVVFNNDTQGLMAILAYRNMPNIKVIWDQGD